MSNKPKAIAKRVVSSKPKIPVWEKERKRRRVLIAVISVVIVIVMALVSYGVYDTHVKPWHQTVVRVNNRVFDMNYFVKMLRLNSAGQSQDIQTTIQTVVTTIEDNELVRQKAEEFGITVTADEIDAELKAQAGYDPSSETEDEFYKRIGTALKGMNISRADLNLLLIEPGILRKKVQEAIGNSDYPRDVQYDYVHVKAVLVGTREGALAVKGNWSEDFSQIVTDYSPDQYFPRGGYWILEVLEVRGEGDAKELHIKGIMLDTEVKAQDIKTQLVAGGDFATLAQANSIHSSGQSGGDLGWLSVSRAESRFGAGINAMEMNVLSDPVPQFIDWLPAGIMSTAFDGFAFDAASAGSGLSDPIRDTTYTTKGGYWLVKVLEVRGEGDSVEFHTQGILLDSNETANDVKAQITAGGDFVQLARDNSLDTDSSGNGGDLGWMNLTVAGTKLGADNLAYIQTLGKDEISYPVLAPVSKQSGYWLIEVLGKEPRYITDDNWDLLSQKAFALWFQKATEEPGLKSYLDSKKLSWALAHL